MTATEADNHKYQERFKWDANERLIVKYNCAWKKSLPHQGRLYITDKHLSFYSKNLFQLNKEYKVSVPWSDISEIIKQSSLAVIPNSISVTTKNGESLYFTSFIYRDQCFDVMTHYHHATISPPLLTFSKSRHVSRPVGQGGPRSYMGARSELVGEGERSALLDDGNQRLRRTLATAESTRSQGAHIMTTLDKQSNQLNRIAGDMEHVHRGLNQADKILGQMETILPGGGRNAARDYESGTQLEKPQGPMRDTRITFLDVTLDKYTPREFVFPEGNADRMYIAMPTGEHVSEVMLASVASIIIHALPTCMTIQFRGQPDLRILAHDLPVLVEELVQRPKHEVHVTFEPNATKFPFFNREGKKVGETEPAADATAVAKGGTVNKPEKSRLFLHGTGKLTPMSAKGMTVDELAEEDRKHGVQLLGTKVQGQIDEGDELLDGISNVMKDLKHMADDMNMELKYQNHLVDNIDESVDKASGKFSKHNGRIKKLT